MWDVEQEVVRKGKQTYSADYLFLLSGMGVNEEWLLFFLDRGLWDARVRKKRRIRAGLIGIGVGVGCGRGMEMEDEAVHQSVFEMTDQSPWNHLPPEIWAKVLRLSADDLKGLLKFREVNRTSRGIVDNLLIRPKSRKALFSYRFKVGRENLRGQRKPCVMCECDRENFLKFLEGRRCFQLKRSG
ncbi:hypothetical protein BCY86_03935 [Pajaroellobacter abortibovis]|uniref:F-box domain-containing protein n=1 Tax=Pajaroellobacter abortibovis TaxID=1882918 RepID=A0A1L6MWK7_9BACT|nr:hypothetical protein BCY86_03935 [Pajaroellobacter abortibovis]